MTADANMISAASPIWTVIMSRIFLKVTINLISNNQDSDCVLCVWYQLVFLIIIISLDKLASSYQHHHCQEPMKPFDIVNVIITLTGILFIIRPPFVFGYDER